MKILITGAAGFIGSSLCESLLRKAVTVVGIDNFDDFYDRAIKEKNLQNLLTYSNFSFLDVDITSYEQLKSKLNEKYDVVVHLAAKAGVRPSIVSPHNFITTNICGTQNILEWMKNSGSKNLIFASSSSVYGNNKVPFKETDPVDNPISPYAFTKKSCELLNYTYHHLYKLSVLNLRFFTVFGPRQRPDLAIHKFFSKIYDGDTIDIYGEGNNGRDYTYIDDIVQGIEASINLIVSEKNPVYEIINIGNSSPVTLKDLVQLINVVSQKPVYSRHLPMQEGDVEFTYADITKAKKMLNYHPIISMQEGLDRFKKWFEQIRENGRN